VIFERNREGTGAMNQAWWCSDVIPALEKLRQEDHELEASLSWLLRQ
jgi:hypothetical protein